MRTLLLLAALTAGCLLSLSTGRAFCQNGPNETEESQLPSFFGVSPRLDAIPSQRDLDLMQKKQEEEVEIPNRPPKPILERPPGHMRLQREVLTPPTIPVEAVLLSKFDGLRQGTNYQSGRTPPDTNGSVGKRWYVQWVNVAFTNINKKTGKMATAPLAGNTPWNRTQGSRCGTHNNGDPIVIYDKVANRWLLSQFAFGWNFRTKKAGPPYLQCVAVSTTDDPAGSYYTYEWTFPAFNDYPKFGIWQDAYYASFNMFPDHGSAYPAVCAFERDKMLRGEAAHMVCRYPKDKRHPEFSEAVAVLPADIDGTRMPPQGSPEYVLGYSRYSKDLLLWSFHVDWSNEGKNSHLSGPQVIKPQFFEEPSCPMEGCVPQKGTTDRLNAVLGQLMYRLSYRNFGDRASLFANHTVKAGDGFGIRWYELSQDFSAGPNSEFELRQQQTFAPDNGYRWLGSMASDKMGNVLMIYNHSDKNSHPSLYFSGRRVDDPLNELSVEGVIVEGKSSVSRGESSHSERVSRLRWGDYASVSLDPGDDCTFWVTGEYMAAPDNPQEVTPSSTPATKRPNAWDTVVASLKFPDCH